jgi:hypothetical protein
MRAAELKLVESARAWGLGVHSTGHVDDLQLLSDLQHYGVATRLIDFTNNPMTALWFACQDPKGPEVGRAGLLLALNTTGWSRHSTVRAPAPTSYDELEHPTRARLASALADGTPFIVDSAMPNDRLRAQEGFFVAGAVPYRPSRRSGAFTISSISPFASIHVAYSQGDPERLHTGLLEERGVGRPGHIPFVAMVIASNLKAKILRYLEGTYNRSAKVLFPDYAGFLEFGDEVSQRSGVR